MKKDSTGLRYLTRSAVIAAVYTLLTLLWPLSFGSIQIRLSEALCVLPLFTPAAIPGLFAGCLLSGLLSGAVWIDVAAGSLTTLLAAFLTRKLSKTRFALLPPVALNAAVTGTVVHFAYTGNPSLALWPFTVLSVGIGEAAAVYGLGSCLRLALGKLPASFW